jgi:hypothetical protein
MKKLFFISFILCSSLFSVKAQGTSSVTVFAQDGEKFWLIMDGIRQNDKPEANVKVAGLTNPNYRLKIIFDDTKIPSIDQNLMTMGGDDWKTPMNASYVIRKNNKGKYVMRANSWQEAEEVPTQGQSVVQFHATENPKASESTTTTTTTAVVAPVTTNTTTTKTTTTTTGTPANTTNAGVNVNVNGMGVNMNVNIQDAEMNENVNMNVNTTTTTTQTTTTKTTGTTQQVQAQPVQQQAAKPAEAPAAKTCSTPMSSADFSNAKSSIEKQSFSDSRYKTAQTITRNNCLSTAQVKEIMKLFSFEQTKLDYAKFAYDFTTDKRNYYMVNDEFSFSSSSDDMNDFLEKKQR